MESFTETKRMLKYMAIKYIFSPVSSLGMSVPIIGGKSIAEILIVTGSVMLALGVTATSGQEGSGFCTDYIGMAVVLLALRNNILTLLFDIPWDQTLTYHKVCGLLFLLCGAVHTYIVLEINPHINSFKTNTGLAAFVIPFMMGLAFVLLKNVQFECFYCLHVLGFMALVPAAYLHNAHYTAYALGLYVIDLMMRYSVCVHRFKGDFEYLPGDVVRLTVPNTFEFSSLQYVFICVPEISTLQFHPFSFSTSPEEKYIKFHIRALGDWTCALKQAVISCPRRVNNKVRMDVYIEGPYGKCSMPVGRSEEYPVVLLISGGVGITPAQSLYNDLYFKHRAGLSPGLRRVHFIWSVRDKRADPSAESAVSVNVDVQSQADESLVSDDFMSSSNVSVVDLAAALEDGDGARVGSVADTTFDIFTYALPLAFQPPMRAPDSIEVREGTVSNPVDLARQISAVNPSGVSGSPLGEFQPRDSGIELRNGSSCTVSSSGDSPSKITAEFTTDFYMTRVGSVVEESEPESESEPEPDSPLHLNRRPDIPNIFADTAKFCKQHNIERVAVVVCGPSSMVRDVHTECVRSHKEASSGSPHPVFDLHVEEFCI